ncbi:segregation/condensation protein A [Thermostichus vulcanus]|uniref:Segregation and condensation protein A n=1 Tax=Thermostichus vulcanus str. 'Rupite' TaxID=2813851 RepID=A0ABT0CDA1_THEVL|nr:segregation/condensation protein A [Thermostichus vulcanus]MCJ2543770.1 segregation/condensation protein A [Thermostichus vulcanus str. 'Rupite']
MAFSPTEEAISLLIDLAERGEIDPWDVQVIEVIDRFLSRMAPTSSSHDLSESGQALLYAAMLVYLKAMALAEPEPEAEEAHADLMDAGGDPLPGWSLAQLDRVLQPRAVPRLSRTRPVTLKELIGHLQELETLLEQRSEPTPKPLTQRISRKQALSAITQLAHPENLLETTAELESLLAQLWQQGFAHISFGDLQQYFRQKSSVGSVHPIQMFWSLLLMASRSQVELHQEEFYGPLTVLPCKPGSPVK